MTPILLTVALLATIPHSGVVTDRACCLEINHYCDSEAQEVFVQLIVWELHKGTERCIDWRLVKQGERGTNIEINRDYSQGDYVARWMDGETFRELRAPCWRETWSQYDKEQVNRSDFPQEHRRKLAGRGVR